MSFTARDLMTTAVFAVLLIVVTYVIGLLGIISPFVWLLIIPVQAVVGGVVVMLFLTRVRHAGMLLLFSAVVALFYLIGGNSIISTIGVIGLGVLAEFILWAGGYRSKWAAVWSYTVFGLSFGTPFLPLLIDREAYFSSTAWQEMGEEYVAASDTLLSAPVVSSVAGVLLMASFVGALLGSAILRKHFVRAGLA